MGQKNLTFHWQQDIPNPNDFAGWKLYSGQTAGGPYTVFDTINYTAPQTDYSVTRVFPSPDGQLITYYFVMTAFDKNKNESKYSNEANVIIDFQAPTPPFSLTITVESV